LHWDVDAEHQAFVSGRVAFDNLAAVQRINDGLTETAILIGQQGDLESAVQSSLIESLQESHPALSLVAITSTDFSPLAMQGRSDVKEALDVKLRRAIDSLQHSVNVQPAIAQLSDRRLVVAYPVIDRNVRRIGYLIAVIATRDRMSAAPQWTNEGTPMETKVSWVMRDNQQSMGLSSRTPAQGHAGNAIQFLPLNAPFDRWLVRAETSAHHPHWGHHAPTLLTLLIAIALTAILAALGLAAYIQRQYVIPLARVTKTIEQLTDNSGDPDDVRRRSDPINRLRDAVESLQALTSTRTNSNQEQVSRLFAGIERAQRRIENMADGANLVGLSIDLPGCTISYHTGTLLKVLGLNDTGGALGCLSLLRCFTTAERRLLVNHARVALKEGESRFELPVGNTWFECHLQRHYNATGDRLRIDCLCMDITERHSYEASLARSEAHQTALITGAFEGILTLDRDGVILNANPAACRLLNAREDALRGLGFSSRFLAEGERLPDAIGPNVPPTWSQLCTLQVSEQQIPVIAALLMLSTGQQALYLYDLRAIMATEAALNERNAIIKAIFEVSTTGMISFDSDKRVTLHNRQLVDMLNLHRETLDRISEADFLALVETYRDRNPSIKIRRALAPGEEALIVRDPISRILKYSKHALFGIDNAACVYRVRDITDNYQLDAMKSNFLATAAHELRTPLTTIMGFSEILSSPDITVDPAESQDLLRSIFQQSQLLGSLINDLLDLARIDADGGESFNPHPIDLRAFLQTFHRNITTPGAGMRLKGQHPCSLFVPERALWVEGDSRKLERIVQNLCGNADKYSAAEAPIIIRLDVSDYRGQMMARINIEDRGIGMTSEELAHAKTRFWRADNSGKIPGTGLGLALVAELVELHRGHLVLASSKGEGTTASVYLPLAGAEAGNDTASTSATVT
jgi:signal transduction histidine kinase